MEKKLFLGANTPDGFVGFFGDVVEMYDLKKLYILKGGSGVGKSTFIRKFAENFRSAAGKDFNVSWIYCSSDPKSLDGAILENLGIGIIDGTAPHMTDPKYPGVTDEIIDLGKCIVTEKLDVTREWLDKIYEKKRKHYQEVYKHLAAAREAHQELEKHYTAAVNFATLDKVFAEIIENHNT